MNRSLVKLGMTHIEQNYTFNSHSCEGRNPENMYYVYILASKRNGTLYVGSTSKLTQRVWQHKESIVEGFTKEHKVQMLVYFEEFTTSLDMVTRERNIKRWKREWKIGLIEKTNPEWTDLYESIL